jgi:hypothetical protein
LTAVRRVVVVAVNARTRREAMDGMVRVEGGVGWEVRVSVWCVRRVVSLDARRRWVMGDEEDG